MKDHLVADTSSLTGYTKKFKGKDWALKMVPIYEKWKSSISIAVKELFEVEQGVSVPYEDVFVMVKNYILEKSLPQVSDHKMKTDITTTLAKWGCPKRGQRDATRYENLKVKVIDPYAVTPDEIAAHDDEIKNLAPMYTEKIVEELREGHEITVRSVAERCKINFIDAEMIIAYLLEKDEIMHIAAGIYKLKEDEN